MRAQFLRHNLPPPSTFPCASQRAIISRFFDDLERLPDTPGEPNRVFSTSANDPLDQFELHNRSRIRPPKTIDPRAVASFHRQNRGPAARIAATASNATGIEVSALYRSAMS
ncbi:hypothetical protein FQR65_LT20669 [Abscondita terminalis]|nr:hypothetical protein FQR65_LT20669 [Abscondita terminalis]